MCFHRNQCEYSSEFVPKTFSADCLRQPKCQCCISASRFVKDSGASRNLRSQSERQGVSTDPKSPSVPFTLLPSRVPFDAIFAAEPRPVTDLRPAGVSTTAGVSPADLLRPLCDAALEATDQQVFTQRSPISANESRRRALPVNDSSTLFSFRFNAFLHFFSLCHA